MFGNDVFTFFLGAAAVGLGYFLYLAGTRGLPAALAWARAKWNAGKADLAGLQGDVEGLAGKVSALEQGAIAELGKRLAAVEIDVGKLKPPAAPAFLSAAAPAAPSAGAQGQA